MKANESKMASFKLDAHTMDCLREIAEYLAISSGEARPNITAAIRFAARQVAEKIRRKKSDGD